MAREGFIGRSIRTFVRALGRALESEELANTNGLLQSLDPRVKVIGLLGLLVAAAVSRSLTVIVSIFGIAVALAVCSRVPVRMLATRIWIEVLAFTGVIVVPAIFITPGRIVYRLPLLGWPITFQGGRSALYLIGRTETVATLALLLVLCTPWAHVLKALRTLRVPAVFLVILGMTYRYVFLLLQAARDMFESRQSRTVGNLSGRERRRLAAATAGALISKTLQLSSDVYMAMRSRGFNGEAHILPVLAMKRRDYAGLVLLLGLSGTALWLGR